MRVVLLLSCSLLCCTLPAQETARKPLTFAVATIKPSAPDTATMTQIRGNRFVTEGTTFVDLFKYAFDVNPQQVVGGPEWLRIEKFDVVADPETENRAGSGQMKALVQQLLQERFHLQMHQGKKILSVYALVKTSATPKLKESTGNDRGIPVAGYIPSGQLSVGNATMADFAKFLQRYVLDRPAVDQTGIAGHFDLELRWTPDNATAKAGDLTADEAAAPPLFTAIKEQLGLKLEAKKADTDVFVIDRVEQPSEN